MEALINLNPISVRVLCDEAVAAIGKPLPDGSDHTRYSTLRVVVLQKLEESKQEILDTERARMEKIERVLREYGSIQAYREYVADQRRQYENDKAAFLKKEQEKKAQEEAARRKANERNSEAN